MTILVFLTQYTDNSSMSCIKVKEKTTRNFSEYLTPRSIVLCLILLGLLFFSRYILCRNHVPKPHKCHIICTSNTYLKNCRCIYNSHLNICGGCNILNIHGQTTHPPWSTWPSCLCYTSYTDLILVCIKGSPDLDVTTGIQDKVTVNEAETSMVNPLCAIYPMVLRFSVFWQCFTQLGISESLRCICNSFSDRKLDLKTFVRGMVVDG